LHTVKIVGRKDINQLAKM